MNLVEKYQKMKARCFHSYWEQRALSQLGFLICLSEQNADQFHAEITREVDRLYEVFEKDGVLPAEEARRCEQNLSALSAEAKKYKVHLAAHAHIDMNWMWGFQETVGVTVDTFRTMLDLMDEYPSFTFSQSQASTYRIVEEYAPRMLDEIKKRVHEGRWELTAGAWVETDKNMPDGESLARHILYTKKYLSRLFEVAEDSMQVDYQPDTFGHNLNVPEILSHGGIKYYYHCRGYSDQIAYRWQSPSGASVLCWREPDWYLGAIEPDTFADTPLIAKTARSASVLKVYGVGDHGGGPTRRDLDRLIDMQSWPLYPTLIFSTYHAFYRELEKIADTLPVEKRELNPLFTGCYTSQSRIKMANRISEDRIHDAEVLDTMAALGAKDYQISAGFNKTWEKLLFNHFHDIIPGSGTIETREYALGEFQKILAAVNTNANHAMRSLAAGIDTMALLKAEACDGLSEGAGVGYDLGQQTGFRFPQTERGRGDVRLLTLFNTTQYPRTEVAEFTLWDWLPDHDKINARDILATDASGNETALQILQGKTPYWGHTCLRLALSAELPPFGYATYVIKPREPGASGMRIRTDPRVEGAIDDDIVLENKKLKAVFDAVTMKLKSLTDKVTGKEMADASRPCGVFKFTTEHPVRGASSWTVGRTAASRVLNETERVNIAETVTGGIRQQVKYVIPFENSKLTVTVILDEDSPTLTFNAEADWHEVGNAEKGTPALSFVHALPVKTGAYRYDIPFGTITRASYCNDLPGRSFIAAQVNDRALLLTTDSKYGYRGYDDALAVNLIRGTFNPDPYPEYGVHNIKIGLSVCDGAAEDEIENAARFAHPISFCANTRHAGTLLASQSLLRVEGRVKIACLKDAEAGDGRILRLYNAEGTAQEVKLCFGQDVHQAAWVDLTEKETAGAQALTVKGKDLTLTVDAYAVASVKLRFS